MNKERGGGGLSRKGMKEGVNVGGFDVVMQVQYFDPLFRSKERWNDFLWEFPTSHVDRLYKVCILRMATYVL